MPKHSLLSGADLHEPKGAAAAASGQVYVADGAGSGSFQTLAYVASVSSTDNAVTRFDGVTGAVQDSGVTIDDTDNVDVPGNLDVGGNLLIQGVDVYDIFATAGVKIFKAADESVNNSSTLQDDDDFVNISLAANTDYFFHGELYWASASTVPGLKFTFNLVSGTLADSSIHITDIQPDSAGIEGITTGAITDTHTLAMGSPGGTNTNLAKITGFISVTNAAVIKLQWAQDVATAVNTTIKKGSFIEVHK